MRFKIEHLYWKHADSKCTDARLFSFIDCSSNYYNFFIINFLHYTDFAAVIVQMVEIWQAFWKKKMGGTTFKTKMKPQQPCAFC